MNPNRESARCMIRAGIPAHLIIARTGMSRTGVEELAKDMGVKIADGRLGPNRADRWAGDDEEAAMVRAEWFGRKLGEHVFRQFCANCQRQIEVLFDRRYSADELCEECGA